MSRLLPVFVVAALAGGGTVVAVADHPSNPSLTQNGGLATGRNAGSGHPDAAFRDKVKWELVTSFATGNPHTDLDFFTQGANTYASVGTLAAGPNGGGQTIIKLAEGDTIKPSFVSSANTAQCVSDPSAALGLQHDVEAAPKGNVITNTLNPLADKRDAQLIIDATDGRGRCHDQGTLGVSGAPLGGLELIDITDITKPKEIGLTSHIGQSHTVNVDPKRPHIAFSITSDAVGVTVDDNGTPDNKADDKFKRANEVSGNGLDGFEVVDSSSCMNFAAGTSIADKRAKCRPQVFRYRYPTAEIGLGHTQRGDVYGCHESEIYPDDRLTCGAGNAAIVFDLKGAFDDNGTPDNYLDDKPRGTPLPCTVRPSSSVGPFVTTAMVTDCATTGTVVAGQQSKDLRVSGWLKDGAPSLEGVKFLGSVHHQGRGAGSTPGVFDATQDNDFDHELELTPSGRFLLATDERGGGVTAPGASCSPGADLTVGNGGIHAYSISKIDPRTDTVVSREEAQKAYALTSKKEKAIYRTPIRTQTEGTFCTSHVMQIIPGQNRIFMGWYTQGTQVVDFTENADGTIDFVNSGYFIPENANTWTSHVFKVVDNKDGTFTYFGATGDFNLGAAGRNAIDIYKVTMPAPPKPFDPVVTPNADTAVAALSMSLSSREITAGNKPMLSGVATNAAGEPVKNTQVQLSEKRYATTAYQPLMTLTTDELGRFRTPVAPLVQTAYGVTVGRVASRTQVVGVHTRMDINSPTAGSTVSNPPTLSGTLGPAFAGGAVGLAEKLPDGRFRYLAQSTSDPSTGAYRLTGPALSTGRHVLVAYTSPRNGNLFGSKSITVTVR